MQAADITEIISRSKKSILYHNHIKLLPLYTNLFEKCKKNTRLLKKIDAKICKNAAWVDSIGCDERGKNCA